MKHFFGVIALVLVLVLLAGCAAKKEVVYTITPVNYPIIKRRAAVLPIYDGTDFGLRMRALQLSLIDKEVPLTIDANSINEAYRNEVIALLYSYRKSLALYYLLRYEAQTAKDKQTLAELRDVILRQREVLDKVPLGNMADIVGIDPEMVMGEDAGGYETPLSKAASALLVTDINTSRMFQLLERSRLDDVMREQALLEKGLVNQPSAREAGSLIGAELLFMGKITNFTLQRTSTEGTIPTGLLLYLGAWAITGKQPKHAEDWVGHTDHLDVKNYQLKCKVDLRCVDAITGEILYAYKGDAEDAVTTVYISGIGGGVDFSETMAYKVLEKAVHKAAYFMLRQVEQQPFRARVADVKQGMVYLNVGSANNITPGMTFGLYTPGDLVEDPQTGVLLGFDKDNRGTIKVVEVFDRYATASPQSGVRVTAGDYLVYLENPHLPASAPGR